MNTSLFLFTPRNHCVTGCTNNFAWRRWTFSHTRGHFCWVSPWNDPRGLCDPKLEPVSRLNWQSFVYCFALFLIVAFPVFYCFFGGVNGKWFEPRGISYLFGMIFWVRVVFRKTVVSDWRFDYLSGSHLQSHYCFYYFCFVVCMFWLWWGYGVQSACGFLKCLLFWKHYFPTLHTVKNLSPSVSMAPPITVLFTRSRAPALQSRHRHGTVRWPRWSKVRHAHA